MEAKTSQKEEEERLILKKSDRIIKDVYSAAHQDSRYLKEFSKKDLLFLLGGSIPSDKFAKRMQSLAVPKLHKISFPRFQNKDKSILNFILYCFPRKVNCFRVYGEVGLPKFKSYFPELIRNSWKVQDEVSFNGFRINQKQLQRIISVFRHAKSLSVYNSIISVPKMPDFTHALGKTRIEKLIFNLCGAVNRSNWTNNPQEFVNLIEGLSKSQDLKQTLNYFSVSKCNLEEAPTRRILNTYGFLNITLIL
ncbi:unnamed protein product [Moneuplotes crassus]|uniref:Uncharacterized protein n=1 Tax=Euplotes crassus TaxID=5936 RepID=A0AAD1UJU3_EUPCR|nr:unnamed protein product [Moneuplotes crassus]